MSRYKIVTINGAVFEFYGRYVGERDTKNWHYYEREDGKMLHIAKSKLSAVFGDTSENILKSRRSIPEGV